MKTLAKIGCCVMLAVCLVSASGKEAKAKYEALVQRVRSGDQTVDLNELRLAAGEGGIVSDVDARSNLMAAARKRDFKKLEQAADAVLKSNYTDLDGHFFAKVAAKELGKPEKEEFHNWVEMGLLKSLYSSGDGKSAATALKVISVDEEYFLLRVMGQMVKSQALSTCEGKRCDVMTTEDRESKQEQKWYFNVEIPMNRLRQAIEDNQKSDEKK
jgi:hypothetical protein